MWLTSIFPNTLFARLRCNPNPNIQERKHEDGEEEAARRATLKAKMMEKSKDNKRSEVCTSIPAFGHDLYTCVALALRCPGICVMLVFVVGFGAHVAFAPERAKPELFLFPACEKHLEQHAL